MSVITAWPDSTLGSESTEPLETARHRRYLLDPPPTQDSHPWVCPNASRRTLLPLPSPPRSFPQPPRARLREMIKTSKALPQCRSKLEADGREPDPAQTSSASPQPEICHSQQLPCSTPLVSPCQSEAPRGSTCSLGWVRAVQSTPSIERQVLLDGETQWHVYLHACVCVCMCLSSLKALIHPHCFIIPNTEQQQPITLLLSPFLSFLFPSYSLPRGALVHVIPRFSFSSTLSLGSLGRFFLLVSHFTPAAKAVIKRTENTYRITKRGFSLLVKWRASCSVWARNGVVGGRRGEPVRVDEDKLWKGKNKLNFNQEHKQQESLVECF